MLKWLAKKLGLYYVDTKYKVVYVNVEKNNALAELERFQTDRLLHLQEFDVRVATLNILEELLEIHGIHDNDERVLVQEIYRNEFVRLLNTVENEEYASIGCKYREPTIEDQVDGFCDVQVFAGGEIGKMGYSNIDCLNETALEINSRVGTIIDGKFQKDKSPEAQANWYKADFSKCLKDS